MSHRHLFLDCLPRLVLTATTACCLCIVLPQETDWLPQNGSEKGVRVKKLLLLVILAGVGYLIYRQVMANQAEQDLWSEAEVAPDLR